MNILIRGVDSIGGYQTKILNRIWERIPCDRCVIISRCRDRRDKFPKNKYIDIPYKEAGNWHSDSMEDLDAVPEWILTGMQKYEGRIYETMIRECLLPVFTFEECKARYLNELFYWYHIITKHKIDYMIFHNAPHFMHDYVIYCLGTVLKIPTLLFMPSFFPGRLEWGTVYNQLGFSIEAKYKELIEKHAEVNLPPDLSDVYHKYRRGFEKEEFKKVNRNFRQMYETVRHNIVYLNKDNIAARRKPIRNKIISAKSIEERKRFIGEYLYDIDLTKRCKAYLKNTINIAEYDKYEHLSEKALREKYIYYGLQCSPESSLMPKLPVFYEQRHMIAILAKAAGKCGLKLYIKEHWNQPVREKQLYEFIRQFQNVRLFGPDESNIALLKNSVAVSTGTGSCIMEGMFNGIPALTFGDGYWNGAPGVYRVSSEEDCRKAIQEIQGKKYEITDEKIMYYLQAVAEETVPMNLYQKMKFGSPFSDSESIENISEFIINWIESNEREK